ncbi:hypothetical protein CEXT_326451 [Caerostris extrusa]|uniref:Uncharacterized protein n=1 Tax=Caerostris extrusa TaxID=172846 RepID=A0AAV4NGC2_CAEEX|nr:hypothetical protein CEXT_326451 [Caerostris extrusa]
MFSSTPPICLRSALIFPKLPTYKTLSAGDPRHSRKTVLAKTALLLEILILSQENGANPLLFLLRSECEKMYCAYGALCLVDKELNRLTVDARRHVRMSSLLSAEVTESLTPVTAS